VVILPLYIEKGTVINHLLDETLTAGFRVMGLNSNQ